VYNNLHLAKVRQQDMLTQAANLRQARNSRALSQASRRVDRARRRLSQAQRRVRQLRRELEGSSV
jgi:hypothetical protein